MIIRITPDGERIMDQGGQGTVLDKGINIIVPKKPYLFDSEPMPEYGVRRISFAECKAFCQANHYMSGMGNSSTADFGLFDGAHLIGVIHFQTPGSEATRAKIFGQDKELRDRVTGLSRLVILDVTPKNTESRFIARALSQLKEIKPHLKSVISFADLGWGHRGTIYRATNAKFYGRTGLEPFWISPQGKWSGRYCCGVNRTPEWFAANGWKYGGKSRKNRYCFLLPDGTTPAAIRRSRAQLESELAIKDLVAPYPTDELSPNGYYRRAAQGG